MKSLIQYIIEKLKINSNSKVNTYKYHPESKYELTNLINERIKNEGDDIDFNDIDISDIDELDGVFAYKHDLKHIDISNWDVSNVIDMMEMFAGCKNLESIGDISNWNTHKLKDITGMFYACEKLKNIGDLNKWDHSNIKLTQNAFSLANSSIIPDWV